jgi:hypothetical protein
VKSFFIKLVAFLSLFSVVDLVVGYGIKTINEGVEKGDYGRNNYIMKEMTGKDILVFGSSRAIHHYDPHILSDSLGLSCFNCGEDGMGIILSYSRLKAVLKRYTPKVVVYDIEISYDLAKDDNARYLGKLNLFYPDYDLEQVYNDVSTTEKYKMISHLYRYNSQLVDIFIQRISSYPEYARDATFFPLMGKLNYMPETPRSCEIEVDSLKVKYLNMFISKCEDNKIKLFFTVSPKFLIQHDCELSILKRISAQRHIQLLSHYNDTTFTLHKELFVDPVHLNSEGSCQYTKVISSEIKKCVKGLD